MSEVFKTKHELRAEIERLTAELKTVLGREAATHKRHDKEVDRLTAERDELRGRFEVLGKQAMSHAERADKAEDQRDALAEALREYMEHDEDYAALNNLGDHTTSHRWKRASAALAKMEGRKDG